MHVLWALGLRFDLKFIPPAKTLHFAHSRPTMGMFNLFELLSYSRAAINRNFGNIFLFEFTLSHTLDEVGTIRQGTLSIIHSFLEGTHCFAFIYRKSQGQTRLKVRCHFARSHAEGFCRRPLFSTYPSKFLNNKLSWALKFPIKKTKISL